MSGPSSDALQRDHRTYIIEIIGPPGSGKSTIAATLETASDSVRRISRYRALRNAPAYVSAALKLLPVMVARPRSRSERARKQLNWMIRLSASPRLMRDSSAPTVVFDQGPTYTMVRLLDAAGTRHGWRSRYERWWRRRVQDWATMVDLLVFVDATDATLVDRIRSRPKEHAAKALEFVEAVDAIRQARQAYESIVREICAAHPAPILRADTGNESPQEIASRITRALRDPASARPGGH